MKILLLLSLFSAALASLALNSAAADTNTTELLARGHIVNALQRERRTNDSAPVVTSGPLWGFKTREGKTFVLQRGKFSEAIWLDERVRARELELRLRLSPNSPAAEVLALRSERTAWCRTSITTAMCASSSRSPRSRAIAVRGRWNSWRNLIAASPRSDGYLCPLPS